MAVLSTLIFLMSGKTGTDFYTICVCCDKDYRTTLPVAFQTDQEDVSNVRHILKLILKGILNPFNIEEHVEIGKEYKNKSAKN